MAELSEKCTERCEYGSTICAGPDHFCQLRRDELIADAAEQKARGRSEDCLEPYGHAAHVWTTGWGPRKGEPRWCPGSTPVPNTSGGARPAEGNWAVHVDLGADEVAKDVSHWKAVATCQDRLLRRLGYDPVVLVVDVPLGQRVEVELRET